MKTLALLALLLCGTVARPQGESCFEATPFVYFDCENYNVQTTHSVNLCYSKMTGGDSLDFTFGYTVYCPSSSITYTLYNGLCDSITSNSTGNFSVAPNILYVVCGRVTCDDTTGLGIQQVCATEQVALPVEFGGVTVFASDVGVTLQWVTFSERDARAFAVLRSRDLVDWKELVLVPAVGNSVSTNVYRWTDTDPIDWMMYYQLKVVDVDGGTRMLDYIPVWWQSAEKASLGPWDLLGRRVRPE